jgi:hypothetical protein
LPSPGKPPQHRLTLAPFGDPLESVGKREFHVRSMAQRARRKARAFYA